MTIKITYQPPAMTNDVAKHYKGILYKINFSVL